MKLSQIYWRLPLSFDGGPLSAVYEQEDQIPAAAREFYTEQDGKWLLQCEIPGVAGIKTFTDFSKLGEALRKERNDHGQLKNQVRAIGVPLAEVRAHLDRVGELEAELAAAGDPKDPAKIDALVEKRVTAKLAPVQRELEQTKNLLTSAQTEIESFRTQGRERNIRDEVRKAASAAKMLPEAIDDALLIADRLFEIDDGGSVVTKEGLSNGVTAGISPADWVATMQQKRPHWWGTSVGGGAGGGGRGDNQLSNNPWTHEGWNMTAQAQILKSDPTRANALAKAAGHKQAAGALKPQPPAKK